MAVAASLVKVGDEVGSNTSNSSNRLRGIVLLVELVHEVAAEINVGADSNDVRVERLEMSDSVLELFLGQVRRVEMGDEGEETHGLLDIISCVVGGRAGKGIEEVAVNSREAKLSNLEACSELRGALSDDLGEAS